MKYGSDFFKGRSFRRSKSGDIESKPEHTTTFKTGDNKSKTEGVDNLAVGTNPSFETGDNIAKKAIYNAVVDKDISPHVTEFLSKRRTGNNTTEEKINNADVDKDRIRPNV